MLDPFFLLANRLIFLLIYSWQKLAIFNNNNNNKEPKMDLFFCTNIYYYEYVIIHNTINK